MFTENVEKIVGMTMAELGDLQENDKEKFYDRFDQILFSRFKVRITSRLEVYNVSLEFCSESELQIMSLS